MREPLGKKREFSPTRVVQWHSNTDEQECGTWICLDPWSMQMPEMDLPSSGDTKATLLASPTRSSHIVTTYLSRAFTDGALQEVEGSNDNYD